MKPDRVISSGNAKSSTIKTLFYKLTPKLVNFSII